MSREIPITKSLEYPIGYTPERPRSEKESKLHLLRRAVQGFVSGTLIAIGGLEGYVNIVKPHLDKKQALIEKKSKHKKTIDEQRERLKFLQEKEKKVREIFGDFYPYQEGRHSIGLSIMQETFDRLEDFDIDHTLPDYVKQTQGRSETKETTHFIPQDIHTDKGDVRSEDIVTLFNTFPRGWVYNEVFSLEQEEYDREATYRGVTGVLATAQDRPNDDRIEIKYYKVATTQPPEYVIEAFFHELAHGNDWERDNEMTAEERADLILGIYRRVIASDRYQSSYVESINEKDPKKNLYYKCVEYWAEICEQYFSDHTKLHYKDFIIVDRFVRKTDPDYDFNKSKKIRDKVIKLILSRLKKNDTDSQK